MKVFICLYLLNWITQAQPIYPSLTGKDAASSIETPPLIIKEDLKFDYPEEINQLSAINRVEVPANDKKTFHFQISESTTNCTISLSYYISMIKNDDQTSSTKAKLKVYDPNGQLIDSASYRVGSKNEPLLQLSLGHAGRYKFVLSNNNLLDMVVDIVFGMTNCYSIKHNMHSKDLIQFKNRFEAYQMKQTVS